MKTILRLILATALLHVANANATNPYGGQDMQKMMQMMQQAQACMEKVDTSQLEKLHEKGQRVETRVKKLCKAGDTAAALREGMAFAKTVNSSSALKQMRKCTDKLRGMLPPQTMAMMNKLGEQQGNANEQNICSGL